MGNHRVEHRSAQLNAVVGQNHQIVFQVLSHLQGSLILIHGSERLDNRLSRISFGGDRHIECLALLHRKAQSYQFGINGLGARGLCVQRNLVLLLQIGHQLGPSLRVIHQLIVGRSVVSIRGERGSRIVKLNGRSNHLLLRLTEKIALSISKKVQLSLSGLR